MHAHEVHTCEAHTYEVHALEMHVRKVLGSPTLQTVVRWSICRDLSCKIRVFALRDKRSLWAAAAVPSVYIVVTSNVLSNVANAPLVAGYRRYPPRHFASSPSAT